MLNVLYICNIPSPYRVAFFNVLGKSCHLTVAFEKRKSDERQSNWESTEYDSFEAVFLPGVSFDTDSSICFSVRKLLKKRSFDCVVVGSMTTPTGIIAITYLRYHKIPFFLEGDGGFPKATPNLATKNKGFLFRGACGYFSTSSPFDNYLTQCGVDPGLIIRYPFSSLSESDIDEYVDDRYRYECRSKLDIKEKRLILTVGRFSYLGGYGKGYDVLMRAAERLPRDIGWYIVGEEPTQEFSDWKTGRGLDHVHFVGYKTKEELKDYYHAADLFVFMTIGDVWGLVVNEAMACGLPVITTDKCVAGLELVENGKNGYIIPVGDDEKLASLVDTMFADSQTLRDFGKRSIEVIRPYTIENMAKTHIRAFESLLSEKQ